VTAFIEEPAFFCFCYLSSLPAENQSKIFGRVRLPGLLYHVMARGNNGQKIKSKKKGSSPLFAQLGNKNHYDYMSHPAEKIIESFDALSDAEKREVIAVLLRKTATLEPMTDDELLAAADQVFLDLDHHEAKR
jgi:hypothetical protein